LSAIELTDGVAETTGAVEAGPLRAAARTHRGSVRRENQDAFVCAVDAGVFAVIDGMGGERGGRRAATLAREALERETDPVEGLRLANARIYGEAHAHHELEGMGCVASAVRLSAGVARIAHVGDTRVYLAGTAGCEQLTRDHTLAASTQEQLGLSHRGARRLSGRNQVTRDLGGRPRADGGWIDSLEVPLEQGALLLLCSDGLYQTIGTDELFARLRAAQRARIPPARLVDELVDLALERGAADNLTAVVVRQEGAVPARADDPGRTPRGRSLERRLRAALLPFLLGLGLGLAIGSSWLP
jgi:protein phosphatase